jgi:prophage regulatory protein
MSNPGLEKAYAYAAELQSAAALSKLSRHIRKAELQKIVPLAHSTIYEMEKRNEFPRRFYLTPRTPVWDLAEVEAWIKQRRLDSDSGKLKPQLTAVHKRKWPPVRD